MKLLSLLAAAALLLPLAADAALQPSPPEATDPIWSLQLSLTDQGWPLRRQLLEALDPAMSQVPVAEFMQLLDGLELRAFPGGKNPEHGLNVNVAVDMYLAKDFPARILERFKSRQGAWETIEGCAVQRVPGPAKGADYWFGFPSERHFIIAPSRASIETALRHPAAETPAVNEHGDLLTVRFDGRQLREAVKGSELLSSLSAPVELRFSTEGDRIRVTGETELRDARTAKRAQRIIDGMVAAVAGELPPKVGESLDERLQLTVDQAKLGLKLDITSEEFKAWLDALKADLAANLEVRPELKLAPAPAPLQPEPQD